MNCARYHELISRYTDNEVTPRQRQDLLHHVEQCRDCAAWLARVRQAEVLLKGVPDTRPSDRVRSAVLQTVREHGGPLKKPNPTVPASRGVRLPVSGPSIGFLLRFDPSPRRVALAAAACMVAVTTLALQLNLFAPWWGYDKLGFEVSAEANPAVNVSPIPAVSTGYKGVGGPVTVPSLVRLLPAADAVDVGPDEPLRVRFDQPMDRTSVENVLRIDPPASGAFTWDADNEVRFSPSAPGLLRGVTYRVVLSSTARSIAGTPLDKPVAWSFRTRDLPTVVADLPLDFSAISPDASLAFAFSVPMDAAGTGSRISMKAGASQVEVPLTLSWDVEGQRLLVLPKQALPEGKVSVSIGALSRTRTGETLGRAYQFTYDVALPVPRLRFAEGRLALVTLGRPLKVPYEAVAAPASRPNADEIALSNIELKVYGLTADRLSSLGAEARGWPRPLPSGIVDGLSTSIEAQVALDPGAGAYGSAEIAGLRAGIYLLTITAPNKGEMLMDWQVLVVADGSLTLTEPGGPFWATGPAAHAWENAEVSLYSPSGALIEKGLTGGAGLWYPSAKGAEASLAVAQDAGGHIAAYRCNGVNGECGRKDVQAASRLTLATDRPAYLPGQNVNFQVLTGPGDGLSEGTPVVERDVSVSLLMPGGAAVAVLSLKPDTMGGASGLFNLSPALGSGQYKLRVTSGADTRDFPLYVEAPSRQALSVYITPGDDLQTGQSSALTRTVSILGLNGSPAAGASITATLRIRGDIWASQAVKAITDAQGRATLTLPMPGWTTSFSDPGVYVYVEAASQEHTGTAISYLDMTSPGRALAGVRQLASPGLGVAVIAPPVEDDNIRLRLVSLEAGSAGRDLLVLAQSPFGEQASWSLDLGAQTGGDVTLPIPARFAGGRVLIRRANTDGARELLLLPPRNPSVSLQVTTAAEVSPGAALPVTLDLRDKDGQPLAGNASIRFRHLSGASFESVTYDWEPNATISAGGRGAATLTAPMMPGLWQVIARSASIDGSQTWATSLVRVLPGPFLQVPSTQSAVVSEARAVSVAIYNPSGQAISSRVRAVGEAGVAVLGDASQSVDLRPGDWTRLTWRILPSRAGLSSVTFSFVPSASIEGSWPLTVEAGDNARTKVTYVSGSATGERAVGVQVPSGLSDDAVDLEIRASTSLLTTLGDIVGASAGSANSSGAVAAAARLSAAASVASTYRQVGASVPPSLSQSAVERSLLLQQIYSAQRADGGWAMDGVAAPGTSSVAATSYILLLLRRYNLVQAEYAEKTSVPDVDSRVVNRGLAYLSSFANRPLPRENAQASLDEMAGALYALSMYGILDAEMARPLMAYAGGNPGEGLSVNGQASLAMALFKAGEWQDALAVADRIVLDANGQARASAPLLEALVEASRIDLQGRSGPLNSSDYATAAEATARALTESREGTGWRTSMETGDAIWALSRYVAESDEKPQRAAPTILLNDRLLQPSAQPDDPGTISIAVSGDVLHAGTNWLKLVAPAGRTIYYSLTLRATR